MKWNEMKWNEMKWNEMKWNEMNRWVWEASSKTLESVHPLIFKYRQVG